MSRNWRVGIVQLEVTWRRRDSAKIGQCDLQLPFALPRRRRCCRGRWGQRQTGAIYGRQCGSKRRKQHRNGMRLIRNGVSNQKPRNRLALRQWLCLALV